MTEKKRAERKPVKTHAGQLLQELRELQGWTQTELAKRSGFPQGYISDFERGHRGIGLARAKAFAKVFGVHPSIFLFPGIEKHLKH